MKKFAAAFVSALLAGCASQPGPGPGPASAPATTSTSQITTLPLVTKADSEDDPNTVFESEIQRGARRLTRSTSAQPGGVASLSERVLRARGPSGQQGLAAKEALDALQIHIFSEGQADSMLIIGPPPARKTLLVDVGEVSWNSNKNCSDVRSKILALTGRKGVDYLLLTHFHSDHAGNPESVDGKTGKVTPGGGLFCLLNDGPASFKVGALIDPGDDELPYAPTRPKLHQAIIDQTPAWIASKALGRREQAKFGPSQIKLGTGVTVDIVVADGRVSDSDSGALAAVSTAHPGLYSVAVPASPNDFSIGFELSLGNFEMFSAGDLSGAPGDAPYPAYIKTEHNQIYTNVESHAVSYWRSISREGDVEVYRANHHGSGNSSTTDLLDMLRPQVVIYSCGGKYGHPDSDIVERVFNMGAEQMVTTRTDDGAWPRGLPEEFGMGWNNPVGDITISLPKSGAFYQITTKEQTFEYPSQSDAEEASLH